jgi:hypothetical protein
MWGNKFGQAKGAPTYRKFGNGGRRYMKFRTPHLKKKDIYTDLSVINK